MSVQDLVLTSDQVLDLCTRYIPRFSLVCKRSRMKGPRNLKVV